MREVILRDKSSGRFHKAAQDGEELLCKRCFVEAS